MDWSPVDSGSCRAAGMLSSLGLGEFPLRSEITNPKMTTTPYYIYKPIYCLDCTWPKKIPRAKTHPRPGSIAPPWQKLRKDGELCDPQYNKTFDTPERTSPRRMRGAGEHIV